MTSESPRPRWLLAAGVALLYAAAIVVGRSIVQPETGLSLFWPATGVAAAWFGLCRTRAEQLITVGFVYIISAVGNASSGMALPAAAVLGVANVTLGVVPWLTATALRDWQHGRRLVLAAAPLPPVVSLGRLWRVVGGLAVGAAVSIPVGYLALTLAGGAMTATAALAWFDRHLAAGVVIALPVLSYPRRDAAPVPWAGMVDLLRARRVELAWLLAVSVGLVGWVFAPSQGLPLAFLPFALLVWSGTRMPVFVATLHAALVAVGVMVLVMAWGGGPFGRIPDAGAEARTAQAFAIVTVLVASVLVLSVRERVWFAHELQDSVEQQRRRASDLATISNTVPIGMVVVNARGEVERANDAAHRILGRDAGGTLAAHRLEELLRPDGTPVEASHQPSALALRGHTVTGVQLRIPDLEDGEDRMLSIDAAPLTHEPGNRRKIEGSSLDRAVIVFRDVTEDYRRTQQLEAFAGVVAHDLRGPLSAVSGWADMLGEDLRHLGVSDDPDVERSMEKIHSNIGRGTSLISDLLDYSVARTSPLNPAEIDLDEVVAGIQESLVAADPQRGIRFDSEHLGTALADPVMVRQLFANLLGNAVKYTDPDVVPHVRLTALRGERRVRFTVVDNGIGIPADQRADVFEPFRRAHAHDGRFPGTGLGLAIVAQAVSRHGGSITVEDNGLDPGSRFAFSLPAPARPSEPLSAGHTTPAA